MGRGGDNTVPSEALLYGGLRVQGRSKEARSSWGSPETLWSDDSLNYWQSQAFFRAEGGRESIYRLYPSLPDIAIKTLDPDGSSHEQAISLPGETRGVEMIGEIESGPFALWSKAKGGTAIGLFSDQDQGEITEQAHFETVRGSDLAIAVLPEDQILISSISDGRLRRMYWSRAWGTTDTTGELEVGQILAQGKGLDKGVILVDGHSEGEPVLRIVDATYDDVVLTVPTDGQVSSASMIRSGAGHWVISYVNYQGHLVINDGSDRVTDLAASLHSSRIRAQESTVYSFGPWMERADDGSVYVVWPRERREGWSVEMARLEGQAGDPVERTSLSQMDGTLIGDMRICPDDSGIRVVWESFGQARRKDEIRETSWASGKTLVIGSIADNDQAFSRLSLDALHRDPSGEVSMIWARHDHNAGPDGQTEIFRQTLRR
jgi:hypothetical protein